MQRAGVRKQNMVVGVVDVTMRVCRRLNVQCHSYFLNKETVS
jgi:hypothetical protein